MMSPVSALAAAIELGRQGYSCFPCRDDKRPSCTHGLLDASTHDEDLKALWSEFPGPLVGVATGNPSQIAVLDIDKKHPEALEWWKVHRDRLLPTRVHRTRSGGLHLLFGHLDGLRNSASRIAKGVDVRADGGYIIWWPAAGLPVLSDAPCAPWPEDLVEALAVPAAEVRVFRKPAPDDLRPTLHRALGILRTMATAPEGTRNQVLHWCGCRVREMAADGELDPPAEAELLDNLYEAARLVGLTHPEITRTIRSAMRAAA